MKYFCSAIISWAGLSFCLHASMTQTPWQPLYKGIDHSIGTNTPDAALPRLQVTHCLRIDLTDPDVQLFTTPRATNYSANISETSSESIGTFIEKYRVQVAVDANFYDTNPGGSDPDAEGLPTEVFGLQISRGQIVSAADTGPDSNGRNAAILFTTNKVPVVNFNNRPPGTSTLGIYTAVSGFYPVLSNGVNIGAAASTSYPDPYIHQPQPRTAFGLSRDRRYLYLTVIDGRQPGYSDGSTDVETAMWMQSFGAWDAVNMDGGGSTAMYASDCGGAPEALNHSSYLVARGRERYIGSHLGVYAKPLPAFINDVQVVPGTDTATVQWTTLERATGWVEFGLTSNYTAVSVTNNFPVTNHVMTLNGLVEGTPYYFRIHSSSASSNATVDCYFTTGLAATESPVLVFDFTNQWKFTASNLDGVNWQSPGYNDSGWQSGQSLFYVGEASAYVNPKKTVMPGDASTGFPYLTYYFRTRFVFPRDPAGVSLTLSNFVDDGAVFYLNGRELARLRMPTGPVANQTLAAGFPCATLPSPQQGDATTNCSDVVLVPSGSITNLVGGENVLAVEVHNYNARSSDVVFGNALYSGAPAFIPAPLYFLESDGTFTLYWNGSGFFLQRASELGLPDSWSDFPGPTANSPVTLTNLSPTTFYRLRR